MSAKPAIVATLILFALPGCAEDPLDELEADGRDDAARTVTECFNFDLECDDGTVCKPLDLYERKHACLPAQPTGLCDDNSDCGPDGFCVGEIGYLDFWDLLVTPARAGECHSLLEEGELCYNFDFECRGDLVCTPGDRNESYQTCRDAVGTGYCDNDEDCDMDNGYFCAYERANAGQCTQTRGANERCWFNFECDDGYTCAPGNDTGPLGGRLYFCVPLRQSGERCNDDSDCAELDSYCDYSWGGSWKCS